MSYISHSSAQGWFSLARNVIMFQNYLHIWHDCYIVPPGVSFHVAGGARW